MYSDPSGNQYVDYRDKEPNGIAIGAGAGGGLLLGLIDLIKDGVEAIYNLFTGSKAEEKEAEKEAEKDWSDDTVVYRWPYGNEVQYYPSTLLTLNLYNGI